MSSTWSGREGWARPPGWRKSWHFWRHGRSVCGAHKWPEDRPLSELREGSTIPQWSHRCQRCVARSASKLRYFNTWGDRDQ